MQANAKRVCSASRPETPSFHTSAPRSGRPLTAPLNPALFGVALIQPRNRASPLQFSNVLLPPFPANPICRGALSCYVTGDFPESQYLSLTTGAFGAALWNGGARP